MRGKKNDSELLSSSPCERGGPAKRIDRTFPFPLRKSLLPPSGLSFFFSPRSGGGWRGFCAAASCTAAAVVARGRAAFVAPAAGRPRAESHCNPPGRCQAQRPVSRSRAQQSPQHTGSHFSSGSSSSSYLGGPLCAAGRRLLLICFQAAPFRAARRAWPHKQARFFFRARLAAPSATPT